MLSRCLFSLTLLYAAVYATPSFSDSETHLSIASQENIYPLVELYTSEGCSSCPRADDFLTDLGQFLGKDLQAVPLAFHVDYWNWLGWEDPFSKPAYTDRQRKVAQYNRQSSIYTPEIVVGGKESRGGLYIIEKIEQQNAEKSLVAIMLNLTAKSRRQLEAEIRITNKAESRHAGVHIAIYENNITRQIGGGENEGRTLIHNYIVRHWSKPIAAVSGDSVQTISLNLEQDWNAENLGVAVVVLDTKNGETLQSLSTPIGTLY